MKIIKSILIAILVSTAVVNNANADGYKSKVCEKCNENKVIYLTLLRAMQSPGLVTAMYQQLSSGFLGGPGNSYYTFTVYYQKNFYRITGTYNQWKLFFTRRGIDLEATNYKVNRVN